MPLSDITETLVTELAALAPHGSGNPQPVFAAYGVRIASPVRRLGQDGQHARFRVEQDGAGLEVIAFQQGDNVSEAAAGGGALDIAFTPVINAWRDRRTLELQLRDLRPHAPDSH